MMEKTIDCNINLSEDKKEHLNTLIHTTLCDGFCQGHLTDDDDEGTEIDCGNCPILSVIEYLEG